MKIPFSNRTVDVELPNTQGQAKVTVKNIMEDFHRQMGDDFPTLFEAFVLLSPRKVRITCRTALNMEEVCHFGLTFRDVRLKFNPVRTAKWVNITRLSYGIPNEVIADALKPYGKIIQIKMDSFHGVYVGVRQVLMELCKPIPSRLIIAAHSCNCFYVGQAQTCFSCHQTGHMTKDCPNHTHATDNIINADGPLTRVNRLSTSTVTDERIGAHGLGTQVRHTTDESHTSLPQLIDGPHPSITASNADSHSHGSHASNTNTNLDNQLLNGSVINSDVPNADVSRDDNVHNINAGGVTSTFPLSSAKVSSAAVQKSSRKDSDDSDDDDDEFVDVLEQLPLPASEGGQQPLPIVLGKRTREPDDSDVSDISEKRVDRNQSSDGGFSSLCDEVDPTSMDHDANGVVVPSGRSTSVQRKVRARKSQRRDAFLYTVDDYSPLPSAPPADDSTSIASEVIGSPSIDAYEGGDEADGGGDNMEPSMVNDNEYPNIPENGSEFGMAQENDTQNTPSRPTRSSSNNSVISYCPRRCKKREKPLPSIFSVLGLVGTVVSTFVGIARAWVAFYGLLFTSQSLDPTEQDFFLNSLSLKLSRAEQSLCEGELRWNAREHWMPWLRSGVITLIHKRGDRLDMKNCRPITLLCADYKTVAKAIANRLLGVIAKVTHSDQTCGVGSRNPLESVRLLKDVVFHANQNHKAAAVISLDQEKAFDRVEWGYLSCVLQTMNFGPSFQKWVFLLYSNIFSCILINGETTEFFSVSRGVRQGCPLSPLLYVLVAETRASAIRADRFIDSYILPNGRSVKLCQYADDTSVIVTTDLELNALFHLFHLFHCSRLPGAKLNVTKCHGLLIGTWQSRSNLPIALDWSNVEIIVLGSRISNDEEQWESKIKALKTTLTAWNRRALSFRGRALIANMLGLSTLWYLCSFSVIPEAIIKAVNGEIFPFVWRKKREWLARSSVTQRPNQGGLGVVDVYRRMLSLHVLWVKRLIFRPNLPLTSFFSQYLTRAFPGRSVHQIRDL
ncbi:Transposon TX1 uncharacterized 149 kDa [Paramuricea clavata]|uniref:Transposon TX1 uncharacterized 149 kDa n=1 Tax=Paramuricea clavata TaxID=317549 RepID=A0A6S7GBM3_PARCT|nr:Transposon TX1 uncharacterized 149 kDa [Paramuricea clavata]